MMTCDRCGAVKENWTDAEGRKISYKDIPGIWYTLGVPINSARELSEHAKKHGLVQRGEAKGKA